MILELLLFVAGILLILKGSDFLVDASVAIGEAVRLPRTVIGGTLVSLATTSPELAVSITSGIGKVPGLAIGNALGSVAVNIGFILALAVIIRPFELSPGEIRWRSVLVLGLMFLLFLMTLDLTLPQWRGYLLVMAGMVYLFLNYRHGRNRYAARAAEATIEVAEVRFKTRRAMAFFFTMGAVMVIGASSLLVNSGTAIAEAMRVPPIIVGLTVVALGTSLPELATAMAAVRKGVFDLSVGNLLGANALNLTLVTGAAASIYPLALSRGTQLFTFPMISLILVVLMLSVWTRSRLMRWQGVLLMAVYVAFVAGLVLLNLG